jgi:hypothetical protein
MVSQSDSRRCVPWHWLRLGAWVPASGIGSGCVDALPSFEAAGMIASLTRRRWRCRGSRLIILCVQAGPAIAMTFSKEMSFVRYLALAYGFWLCSCAFKNDSTATPEYAADSISVSIRSQLSELAAIGQKSRWIEASENQIPIKSANDMDEALSYFGSLDSAEKNQSRRAMLLDYLASSASSYLFGFDSDYSMIVFFDSDGSQSYCFPEQYLNIQKKENKPEMATPRKPSDHFGS